MKIARALLATLCFMPAFCQTGSGEPQLSTRPTQDITVTCQLVAFANTRQSNPDLLQVLWKASGKQDWAAVATLDLAGGKVSASDHLTQPADNFYVVNSANDGKVIRNSWLSISIASVHDTSFRCQVVYSDDGSTKMWLSEAFPFLTTNQTYPGITVTVTDGMSLECFHKPQGTTVTETSLEIVKTETDRDLCPQLEKQNEQHLQRQCSFRNAFDGGAATKEAHIFNATCQDEGRYRCRISGVTSMEIEIYLPGCSATTHQTTSATNLMNIDWSDFRSGLLLGLFLGLILGLILGFRNGLEHTFPLGFALGLIPVFGLSNIFICQLGLRLGFVRGLGLGLGLISGLLLGLLLGLRLGLRLKTIQSIKTTNSRGMPLYLSENQQGEQIKKIERL